MILNGFGVVPVVGNMHRLGEDLFDLLRDESNAQGVAHVRVPPSEVHSTQLDDALECVRNRDHVPLEPVVGRSPILAVGSASYTCTTDPENVGASGVGIRVTDELKDCRRCRL